MLYCLAFALTHLYVLFGYEFPSRHFLIISASLSMSITSGALGLMVQNIRLSHLSVRAKVSCGKTADWIRMPFGVVRGVGRGMGVLDGGGDRRSGRAVLRVNLGRPIVTIGAFATRSPQIRPTLRTCLIKSLKSV